MLRLHRHLIAILGLALVLGGCATNPGRDSKAENYSELYNGEMKVAHEARQHETTSEEAIANGDRALAEGNTDRAMYEYVQALEISGGDAAVLNKIGGIHTRQGNLVLAARAYSLSLKLEAENPAALEGVGLLFLRQRRYEDARRHLTVALEKDPLRWQSLNGLGMLADLDGNHAQAAVYYRQALATPPEAEQQPDNAILLNNLGYSLYLSGDWPGALQYFHEALNYDPDFERVWQNMGLVYARKGQYESSLDAFRRVMDKPEAYNNVGFVCMINQNYDDAAHFFQKAIKLSPTYYVKAHENLNRLNRLRGNDG
jgi:Flp pilus assembly protein TadD